MARPMALAGQIVAGHVGRRRHDDLPRAPCLPLGREQRRHHPCKRAVRDSLLRMSGCGREMFAIDDVLRSPTAVNGNWNRLDAAPTCDAREKPGSRPSPCRRCGPLCGTHDFAPRGIDRIAQLMPSAVIRRRNRLHFRYEIPIVQTAGDLAKIDAQIPDFRTVGHGKVGGDPYQEFMQGEPLRPEGNQLARRKSGQPLHLGNRGDAGKDVCGPEDRR